jgi:predicted short-subunit dehydrogenase-like oxidoreductase (DUF2520 family)
MTFVGRSHSSMRGVPFGIQGQGPARSTASKIVRDIGGKPFTVNARTKALYHAWGTFLSPLFISLLLASERVAYRAGVSPVTARQNALPILRQTLENYAVLGAANSFSGPLVRGDGTTVRRHLRELRKFPELRDVYSALAKVAVRYLPTEDRRGLRRILKQLS